MKKNLMENREGFKGKIVLITCDEKYIKRLSDFGIVCNEYITINKYPYLRKSVLVEVNGILVAIDKLVAEKIFVDEQ